MDRYRYIKAAKTLLKNRLYGAQHKDESGSNTKIPHRSKWKDVEVLTRPTSRTDSATLKVNAKDIKHALYGAQEGICPGCRLSFPFRNLTLDHIRPRSRGGQDTDDNLQLLCGACNSKKGNRTMDELIADLVREGVRER